MAEADDHGGPGIHAGGCFCGAIRYVARAVFDAGYCHCSRWVPQRDAGSDPAAP